jgi:hypothetical protein
MVSPGMAMETAFSIFKKGESGEVPVPESDPAGDT